MIRIRVEKGIEEIAAQYTAGPFQPWQAHAQKLTDDLQLLDTEWNVTSDPAQRRVLVARYDLILKELWRHTGYLTVTELTKKFFEYKKE